MAGRLLGLCCALFLGCASGGDNLPPCEGSSDCRSGTCVDGLCRDVPDSGDDDGGARPDTGQPGSDSGSTCTTDASCDDANACTADSCEAGACSHTPLSCDDLDACTVDACDSVAGCTNEPMPVTEGSCDAPIDISSGGTFTGDSTCAASEVTGVCGGGEAPDVAFVLDLAEYARVDLDASASAFTPVLFVGASCGDAAHACDSSGGARLTAELAAGRHYVGLDGVASDEAGPWSLAVSITPVAREETVTFPASGDTRRTSYENLWNAGDHIEGTRSTSLSSITSVRMDLRVEPNVLSCDTQDMRLLVNSAEVGRFSIASGDASVVRTFTFSAIGGPVYTLRLETTRTVSGGCGSAGLPNDVSTLVLSR